MSKFTKAFKESFVEGAIKFSTGSLFIIGTLVKSTVATLLLFVIAWFMFEVYKEYVIKHQ